MLVIPKSNPKMKILLLLSSPGIALSKTSPDLSVLLVIASETKDSHLKIRKLHVTLAFSWK